MRIVAGTARGRPLLGPGPKSRGIRPTADRVRETVFNILGQFFEGGQVLDLYAGTGALAFEALSRGLGHAVLVDQDREAIGLCRRNAQALGFEAQVEILQQPVARATTALGAAGRSFELVFADPPYAARVVEDLLTQVHGRGLLAVRGALVIEHDKREQAPPGFGELHRVDQRRFGDTEISFYRFA
jgi:16S rRNA (guanine966-N2)-methyltransferase